MLPDNDDAVTKDRRRASFAELISHFLVAEILFPQHLSIHVVDKEAARFEPCVDALSCRGRGARCPGSVLLMRRFVRRFLSSDTLPQCTTVFAIDGHHDESM